MIKVPKNQRHIRWNVEQSPNRDDWTLLHLVIVDDKDREGIAGRMLQKSGVAFGSVEKLRSVSGKVHGSKFRYLFETYEGQIDSRNIDWNATGKLAVQDNNLRERKREISSIEIYVADAYW